jgi:hypothetical protein
VPPTFRNVTAKEQVLAEAPGWTEEQAQRALIAAGSGDPNRAQPPFSLLGAFRSGRDHRSRP